MTAGTDIAGGLFTHPEVMETGKVSIGGLTQNETYFLYELEDYSGGTGPVGVPANLLGYNIYRDGDFVDYTPHIGGTVAEPQGYVHQDLEPGCYDYGVTGVYDLTMYGFPGEEGESMEEGPAHICVDFCYELEFVEDWGFGNFETNNWNEESNWMINGQTGNPAPAAEFTWDPIQTEYAFALTSYPLCASDLTEGVIWLDFDYMLNSFNHTGEEFLMVQVWNWDGGDDWFTVATYNNLDGNISWTSEHINIKAYAMNNVFKIRSQASGMNSLNILSWFVDNIHVYRTCDAPTDLAADAVYGMTQNDILLTWTPPAGGSVDEWIHYDDGVNFTSIGTGAAVEFDIACRWEPSMLVDYDGAAVTEVAFFPAEVAAEYHIRIWVGAGPANMVVDQAVTAPLMDQWNYVTLDTPFPIDISQELWIGYYVNAQTGFPAGADAGPGIDGYGNMMNFGGWQTLLQINPDLDYNWNLQAHVVTISGDAVQLSPLPVEEYASSDETLGVNPNHTPVQPVFAPSTGTRMLAGFNIYHMPEGGEYSLLDYVEEPADFYLHENVDLDMIHCYMITAVYTSDFDLCESDYTPEVCVNAVGLDELPSSSFVMYPNPAVSYAAIESSSPLQRVTVYNALGQLIMDEVISGNKYELNTASYRVGAYLVRVETTEGVSTNVLTIQR